MGLVEVSFTPLLPNNVLLIFHRGSNDPGYMLWDFVIWCYHEPENLLNINLVIMGQIS